MMCRGNQPMRTLMVRALSFSAAAALALNPALMPVIAADYHPAAPVAVAGQMNARPLSLGIGKSIVIDLPRDIKDVTGSIARSPFIAGEPIRDQKLVKGSGTGFMAAILPSGYRAVSTEISPETGAGGFILPNDRVDVLLSKREKNPDGKGPDLVSSEVILTNIRVLGIDQAPKEKDGTSALVGKTATLEVKPDQAETLARARQSGTLSLALRSITDAQEVEKTEEPVKRGEGVNVVRYGVASQQLMQK